MERARNLKELVDVMQNGCASKGFMGHYPPEVEPEDIDDERGWCLVTALVLLNRHETMMKMMHQIQGFLTAEHREEIKNKLNTSNPDAYILGQIKTNLDMIIQLVE